MLAWFLMLNGRGSVRQCHMSRSQQLARCHRPRPITYRAEDSVVLDIVDNGIGIDKLQFRVMFNAGYTTSRPGPVSGLHSAANFVIPRCM